MTSDSPGGDDPRPDDEAASAEPTEPTESVEPTEPTESVEPAGPVDGDDWWDGSVELAPAPDERPAGTGGGTAAGVPAEGSTGAGDGAAAGDGSGAGSSGRRPWLLGAAVVVLVAGVGALGAGLVARDDDSSPSTATATAYRQGGPGGFAPGTSGTITDVDAGAATLVVETSDGDSVEVSTTGDTTISETVEGSADDIEVGDSVLAVGEAGDDGTIAATQVVAGDTGLLGGAGPFGGGGDGGGGFPAGGDPPQVPEGGFPGGTPPDGNGNGGGPGGPGGPGGGFGAGGFTTGTVESIDDGSLSVRTTDDETVTVTLSSETTVLRSQELSFDDLATGDEITVVGESGDDGGTVVAATIRRGGAGFGVGGGFPGSGGGPPGDGTGGGGDDGGTSDDGVT